MLNIINGMLFKTEFKLNVLKNKNKDNNIYFKNYCSEVDRKIGFSRNKIHYLYFNPNDFLFDVFYSEVLLMNFFINSRNYAYLIKLQLSDEQFRMCGTHNIWNSSDLSEMEYRKLFNSIQDKLDNYIEDYSNADLELIQVMFIELNEIPELKLKNINNIKFEKGIVKTSLYKNMFHSNYLPFSMNLLYYGTKLNFNLNEYGYIQKIYFDKNIIYDVAMLDDVYAELKINNVSSILFKQVKNSSNINMFLYKHKFKSTYNLQNEDKIRNVLLILDDNNNEFREIFVFNLEDLENKKMKPKFICKDTPLNKNNSEFIRTINDLSLFIRKDKVIKYEQNFILPTIDYKAFSSDKFVKNSRIGVFDIETYYDENLDKSFTYALGFKVFKGETKMFYKKPNQSSNDLIIECINSMLIPAYNNYIFYVHNLHGYDSVFIINALLEFNSKNNNFYIIKTIFRDNRIIKLTVTIKVGKSTIRKITFLDSYLILSSSLGSLAKTFNCEYNKEFFPYEFVKESNLYYVGDTPDITYFKDISIKEYNSIKSTNWDCEKQTYKYLEKDLLILMEIIDKFSHYIYLTFGVQITDSLTISKLAINILYSNYLNTRNNSNAVNNNLPLINKPTLYNFVKESYFGGISEVYKPYGENLNYYDINSEYPFVSKNSMPGNKVRYLELLDDEIITGKSLDLESLFGFFYCKINCSNDYLGLLPKHINNLLILPNGSFDGIWFSEELKFAKKHGYEIQVIRGYNFNKIENIFTNFVDDLFNIRLKEQGLKKSIAKLLLNSSFGRFGMSISKPETAIVNLNKLDTLLSTRKVYDIRELSVNSYLVNYDTKLSKEILENLNLNIAKLVDKNKDIETNDTHSFLSISTASAITAYARIYINEIKLKIRNLGGEIYYSDTDSIVTNIKLPNDIVGNELGKFKLEYRIKRAIFISSKIYLLELENGSYIKKAKGIKRDSLTLKDYEDLYFNKMDVKGLKNYSKFLWEKGTVNIYSNKPTVIKHNSYIKREKIYNENGLWIDTKPLYFKANFINNQINTNINTSFENQDTPQYS